MQQIMMVGAGAVGGYFGAHLARHNPNVSFLLRPQTLAAVRTHGLTVRSAQGNFTVHPQAASDPRELAAPDLIILANKAYDLPEVLDRIEPVLTNKTIILTLQNGVDIEDNILARVQRDCVVGGVVFIYSKIAQPGVIDHYKRGAVTVGELMGYQSTRVLQIVELFQQAGIACTVSDDIRRAKWEKMCWNCVFNPLTVIINDRVAKALDYPEMLDLIPGIVGEVTAVSAGLKVPLSEDMAEKVVQWTQEIRDIHTSMYDDWKSGRPTEIDSLNGFIGAQGRHLGIPTPLNDALTAMVKVITSRETGGVGSLRIDGQVIQPLTLDIAALQSLPEEHQVHDISSVVSSMKGRGIRLKGLLDVPALAIGADHVTVHAQDGKFSASLTLDQARDFGILLYERDGAPLPDVAGGPFRLVTPRLGDLCANVKYVVRLEVTKGPGKDTRPSLQGKS